MCPYDEELIDPQTVRRSELDDVEASARGQLLERMKDRYPPIDDVAKATSWWARLGRLASRFRADEPLAEIVQCTESIFSRGYGDLRKRPDSVFLNNFLTKTRQS
jgi:hypothetical protein